MHDWNFWVAIASLLLSVILAVGGFIMTLLIAIIAWFLKQLIGRLISTMEKLCTDMEDLRLTMKDKPSWPLVDSKIDLAIAHHVEAKHKNAQ